MEIANLLLDFGEACLKGKIYKVLCIIYGVIIGLIGVILLCCGEYAAEYMLLSGHYAIVNFLIAILYLALVIIPPSIFFYFLTLIVLGLGQIAINTLPENDDDVSAESVPAPSAVAEKTIPTKQVAPVPGKWICSYCQTENSTNYGQCKKCGKFKG